MTFHPLCFALPQGQRAPVLACRPAAPARRAPANDNGPGGTSDPLARAALLHYARHSLAAAASGSAAEMDGPLLAGANGAGRHWLAVARLLAAHGARETSASAFGAPAAGRGAPRS